MLNATQKQIIGGTIRSMRLLAGLKQADLAQAIGVCRELISQIERGRIRLPRRRAAKLARYLGLPLQTLRPDGRSHK